MLELTDEDLAERLKSDPERSARLLYERYSGVLLRFIYRFTMDTRSAEDILHDVFAELLDGKYQPGGSVKSWLFTVAKNKSLNRMRSAGRETGIELADLVASASNPDESLQLTSCLAKLEQFTKRLPGDLAEVWRLRRSGHDYRAIAESLEIPVGTVKSRFSRLVAFLREEFEK